MLVGQVRRFYSVKGLLAISLTLAATLWLTGCSGPKAVSAGPTFYPPPPNLPRIQFLGGFSDSGDVEQRNSSSLSLFGGWSDEGKKIRKLQKPYGLTTYGGKIYICDTNTSKVVVVDLPNKTFEYLKGAGGPGKLSGPVNVATDSKGFIYVADMTRKEVLEFDPDGGFIRALGGDADMKPVDVAVDAGTIYVLDWKSQEIKLFDLKSGALTGSIGKSEIPDETLSLPTNLTLDDKGFLYVTNAGNGKVLKFDRDGHLLLSFGKMGDGFGEFGRPRGIAVDNKGQIMVADAAHQNVQMFNEKGRLLIFFGDAGGEITQTRGALNLPAGITVTTDNLDYYQKQAEPSFKLESVIIVANQFGSPKISIYGVGKKEGIDYEKEYEKLRLDREKKGRELREKAEQAEKLKKEQEDKKDSKGTATEPAVKQ
jgi:DNA-binding beta-propeller fold protein YncE